ncbi:MAG: hypothetical protein IJ191_03240 [Treponema sp.]|nr:hypothetical protein [Treponema sp.]
MPPFRGSLTLIPGTAVVQKMPHRKPKTGFGAKDGHPVPGTAAPPRRAIAFMCANGMPPIPLAAPCIVPV